MTRNVSIVTDLEGRKIVLIHDVRFKGKKREDWESVEQYLKEYVGEFFEISETSEKIFISSSFPDEYAGSESRIALKGAVAKAKANAVQGIPELIQIASNREYSENVKKKHAKDAKLGWYMSVLLYLYTMIRMVNLFDTIFFSPGCWYAMMRMGKSTCTIF